MLDIIPDKARMTELICTDGYALWQSLCSLIDSKYDMEKLWNSGGKKWTYEYKYRCGGKTLCALYARQDCFGLMIVFGRAERERFEAERDGFSNKIRTTYDNAATYHDGKWVMFEPESDGELPELLNLLRIKRRPNKKDMELS